MIQRLLLWDIDSTLITTGGAGEKSLQRIVERRYGPAADLHEIEIAGRTDPAICAAILRKFGQTAAPSEVEAFLQEYLGGLEELLPQVPGQILPGISELLTRLAGEAQHVLALLTGNLQRGAQLKLGYYGLWDYFAFGAFADDHADRNQLGAFARARARAQHGHDFAPSEIDVIGDTGHDIACGKIFGARTIAVATGSWTRAQLAAAEPDFLFDDFSQVDEVVRTLGW